MKPFVVVSDGFDKELFEKFKKDDQFEVHPEPKISQEKLKELLPKVEGLVIRSATTVSEEFLKDAPKLKYVIRAGEGTDNIDKLACEARGIKVSNTPGANNNSAAEHAIALMMSVLRRTAHAHQTMSSGGWDKNKFTGVELSEKKIGIVGFGRIGQIVARRLQGFEPEILFYDPFVEGSELPKTKKCDDLEILFKTCDVVTIHVPKNEKTKNMITKDQLSKMPSKSILINASRGGIVNESDLTDILGEEKIRGAGLDVYEKEPLNENSYLRELPNVVLTPHLGASTEEAQKRVGGMVIEQLESYLLKDKLLNEVKA